ncbi:alpha/beta-hydrolase, partial [Ramaria rubella]
MDPSLYKDLNIGNIKYHYYHHPAKPANPTLLFLHGFPSFSEHWVNQVVYFTNKGHGVIALDMLGYAGTSKILDYKLYSPSAIAAHCVAILDAEGLDKVIVVSHDWGCWVGSKLANLYPERHLGSIFLNISYVPPTPAVPAEHPTSDEEKMLERDMFSLMQFMASDEVPKIIADHEDTFYRIMYTSDPALWRAVAREGEMEKWLLADRKAPVESWAPDQAIFRAGGWFAPTNWYRSAVKGVILEDDKGKPWVPFKSLILFFKFCLRDTISVPDTMRANTVAWCTNATIRELDASHWPMFEKPDELNAAM